MDEDSLLSFLDLQMYGTLSGFHLRTYTPRERTQTCMRLHSKYELLRDRPSPTLTLKRICMCARTNRRREREMREYLEKTFVNKFFSERVFMSGVLDEYFLGLMMLWK